MSWLPIIGSYGHRVPTSESRGAWYQASLDCASEGLLARRQSVFPRGRSVVDGVSSQHACGLRVHQSVQAIGRRGVPRQVWGFTCVSGSRDTTSDDSSARGMGKAAQLQVGRIRHDGQHPKREQLDLLWFQALCPRGAVLVRPSIVLEEEALVAIQKPGGTQGKAQALLERVVLTQSQKTIEKRHGTQGSRSQTLERIQGEAEMLALRTATPRSYRLPPCYQGRQEVGQ